MRRYSRCLPIAFLLLAASGVAFAQETFQYAGPDGSVDWESPANWIGGSGDFSVWPGQAPDADTRDSAVVTGSWPSLSLEIAAPITLDVLQMGASGFAETAITGAVGATLTANRIEPTGSVFATNRLDIDLLLDGGIEFANATTALTLDDRLVNGSPTGAQRTVQNNLDRTLHVNSDVLLSDQAGTPGDLRFVNGGISSTIVAGIISDGAAAGGRVTYARGDFEILAANTYTGSTQLGSNDPNVGATHVIHTDQAFGVGRLIISGGNELKVIRGAGGKGTRTLSNEIQIARRVVFAGAESIVLDGQVFQSNGRRVINEIAATGSLTFNGDIYASDSSDVREWVFDGPGRTIVNGVIDDSLNDPRLTGGSVAISGSGRVVFTNPSVAAYTGETRVAAVLQLGEGADAVGLNGDRVTGDGVLEINHNGTLAFDTLIEGGLQVRHTGPGTTSLSRANTNTGGYLVNDGTLLVSGVTGDVSAGGGVLGGTGTVGAIDVLASGGIAPGDGVGTLNALSIDFQPGSRLEIEVGAAASDRLSVAGLAKLDGELSVSLAGGAINPLDDFIVLSASTPLLSEFANAPDGGRLSTDDGFGSFRVTYDNAANHIVLSDFLQAMLPGDFNQDGAVDAADYTVWRDELDSIDPSLAADGDGDGDIDQDDYAVWRDNFGSLLPSNSAVSSVPEPNAAMATAFTAILLLTLQPRVRTRRMAFGLVG